MFEEEEKISVVSITATLDGYVAEGRTFSGVRYKIQYHKGRGNMIPDAVLNLVSSAIDRNAENEEAIKAKLVALPKSDSFILSREGECWLVTIS